MRRWGYALLGRLVGVEVSEIRALLLACAYGFAIFTAYAVIRPLRDSMALTGGVRDLPWLFAATLVAMLALHPLYSGLVSRWPRRVFVAFTSRFFAVNLGIFLLLGSVLEGSAQLWLARVFFVWTSVFNLFVLSIFWSFLAVLFTQEQARRLFGFIAVGVTVGGIVGSGLTSILADRLNPLFLLPVSMVLLEVAARMAGGLCSEGMSHRESTSGEGGLGGGLGEGITTVFGSPYLLGIAAFMLLYTITATFLYFLQAEVVSEAFADRGARTAFFARLDLMVNTLTLLIQIFATGRLMKKWGPTVALVMLPAVCVIGFLWLGSAPTLWAVAVFQVVRRTTNYGLTRPAREVLYTVVSRTARYKAKNFIDTTVYRAGDQIGAWSWALMGLVGLGALTSAWVAAPLSVVWLILGAWLGRQCARHT